MDATIAAPRISTRMDRCNCPHVAAVHESEERRALALDDPDLYEHDMRLDSAMKKRRMK